MADVAAADAWEALDRELMGMVDTFANMVKAARIPDEEADQRVEERKGRAPGDLLEVWSEKLLRSGFEALQHVASLKSAAALSDFEVLMVRVRKVRTLLSNEEQTTTRELAEIRQDAAGLLAALEDSYYATPHRGRPMAVPDLSLELKELAAISLELAERPDTLLGASGTEASATGGAAAGGLHAIGAK